MALLRVVFTVCVCAVGIAAQEPDFTLWGQLLHLILNCATSTPVDEVDASQLYMVLYDFINNTTLTYDLTEAADAIATHCDPNRRSTLYVPGFDTSANSTGNQKIVKNLQHLTDRYFIIFDTYAITKGSVNYPASYQYAVERVGAMGRALFKLVFRLHELGHKIDLFMGQSLGAQIIAELAKFYYEQTGEMLSNIKAIDPAGPCFPKTYSAPANNIECYHCNAGQFGAAHCNTTSILWMNGGKKQPGCNDLLGLLSPYCSFYSHSFCPTAVVMTAALEGIWQATPCNPNLNCNTGVSVGSGTVIAGFDTTNLSGNYYISTPNVNNM